MAAALRAASCPDASCAALYAALTARPASAIRATMRSHSGQVPSTRRIKALPSGAPGLEEEPLIVCAALGDRSATQPKPSRSGS